MKSAKLDRKMKGIEEKRYLPFTLQIARRTSRFPLLPFKRLPRRLTSQWKRKKSRAEGLISFFPHRQDVSAGENRTDTPSLPSQSTWRHCSLFILIKR